MITPKAKPAGANRVANATKKNLQLGFWTNSHTSPFLMIAIETIVPGHHSPLVSTTWQSMTVMPDSSNSAIFSSVQGLLGFAGDGEG